MPKSGFNILKKFILTGGFGLLLCLYAPAVFAANYPPSIGTLTPASGASSPNQTASFKTTVLDADGWKNIQYILFLTNTSVNGANCFYGYYNQNTNKLYLRNDANTAWLGGFSPGTNQTIENSYAKLDCSKTFIGISGTTLTVNWSVIFKSSFTGAKKTYLFVRDDANVYSGWIQKGTWNISNNQPVTGTITPSSGELKHNQEIIFTTTFTDPDGYLNLNVAYLLFNNSITSVESVYGYYLRSADKLYFYDYSQNKWLGGYSPGSDNLIETLWAKLNYKNTSVSGSANTLSIKWAITFKSPFTGTKNAYLKVNDIAAATNGWTKAGTFSLPNNPPQVDAVSPSSGSTTANTAVSFTTTFSDPDGFKNLYQEFFIINAAIIGKNCFYGYYNQNTNKLYLIRDDGKAWLGGYAPGSNYVIENSYAKLDCAKTTVLGSDNTTTIQWNVVFKPTFMGVKNIYLQVADDVGSKTGWVNKGQFCILRKPLSVPE